MTIPPKLSRETENGVVILRTGYFASRKNALIVAWVAMPHYESRCWRPAVDSQLNQQILPVPSQQLLSHMAAKQKPHSLTLGCSEKEWIGLAFECPAALQLKDIDHG